MLSVIRMLVALEMLALPVWVGAVLVRPGIRLWPRLARTPAAVVLLSGALLVLSALEDGGTAVGLLRAQAVALGFTVLLAGAGVLIERLTGPRATQMLICLVGWLVVGSVFVGAPLVSLLDGPAQAAAARVAVHSNPLVVAEHELGLVWLRQDLTYRLSSLGESYSYLTPGVAWWKTLLAHTFVGSALAVFGARGDDRPGDEVPPEA